MSRRRTTFGKLQRDRDKQAKAKAKVERRAARAQETSDADGDDQPAPAADQGKVLDQLAELHAAYDDGKIELEDFEERRDELTSLLRVD